MTAVNVSALDSEARRATGIYRTDGPDDQTRRDEINIVDRQVRAGHSVIHERGIEQGPLFRSLARAAGTRPRTAWAENRR